MKKLILATLLILSLITPTLAASTNKTVAQHLQEISVTIVVATDRGVAQGSGVLFTRKDSKGEVVNFVWTAGHVIAHARTTREIVDAKGSPKTIVEFPDVQIVSNIVEDGRTIGRVTLDAEVIKYSDADNGEDLAVLRVRKKNFVTTSVSFYLDKDMPTIGTELYHVGSLLGLGGANSMTSGIYSQVGRIHEKKLYDQTTVTAFPGSSGGGVYFKDGRYIGMLVRGSGETFNLIVPIRRMDTFVTKHNMKWALDPKLNMPSNEEIAEIPVEGMAVKASAVAVEAPKKSIERNGFRLIWMDMPNLKTNEMDLK